MGVGVEYTPGSVFVEVGLCLLVSFFSSEGVSIYVVPWGNGGWHGALLYLDRVGKLRNGMGLGMYVCTGEGVVHAGVFFFLSFFLSSWVMNGMECCMHCFVVRGFSFGAVKWCGFIFLLLGYFRGGGGGGGTGIGMVIRC